MLEKFFKLKENGTDVKTEVIGGVTTFMAMAYILAVNPSILSASGMDPQAILIATALASFIGTLCMALMANYPFALAPGLGLNAYFAYTVCGAMGYTWQFALLAVFVEGIIFVILSITNVREAIFDAIPIQLKKGVSVDPGVIDETRDNAECVLRIVASDSDAEEIRMTFVSIFGMEIDLKEYYSDSKYYASLNGILKNDDRIEKLASIAKKKRWTFDTTETQWTRDPYTRDKFFRTHNNGEPDEYKRNKAGKKVGFYRCAYCGKLVEKSQVEVDQIVPVNAVRANDSIYRDFLKELGCESVNDSRNLVAACRECNQKKGASVDLEWIKAGIKLVNNKYIDRDGEEVTQGVFLCAFIILEVALIAITFGIFMLIGKHLSNTLPLGIILFVIDAVMTILIIISCKECKNEYRKNAQNAQSDQS